MNLGPLLTCACLVTEQVAQRFHRGFVNVFHGKKFCPRKPHNATQLNGARL